MSPLNSQLLALCTDEEIVYRELSCSQGYEFSNKARNLITAEIIQSYGKSNDQSDFLGGVLQTDNEMPYYVINALRDMSDTHLKKLAIRILMHVTDVCMEEDFPQHAAYHNLQKWCGEHNTGRNSI